MLLKQTLDGHVLTIATTQGHKISLTINSASPVLSLSGSSGELKETRGSAIALEANMFTAIVRYCTRSKLSNETFV